MKELQITQGKVALVDDEDYDHLNQWKWYYNGGYVVRNGIMDGKGRIKILIHRFIMNTPEGMDTDHINHNKLDNRRENLRVCTHLENSSNRSKSKNNKSGYKGVFWSDVSGSWVAQIKVEYRLSYLGNFSDSKVAALAYNEAAIKHYGKFASLNSL